MRYCPSFFGGGSGVMNTIDEWVNSSGKYRRRIKGKVKLEIYGVTPGFSFAMRGITSLSHEYYVS